MPTGEQDSASCAECHADLNPELIEAGHGQLAAGLLAGRRFSATELPGGLAQHWLAGLFSNLKSYKGAFHMSPDYAWWYGYADVLGHLARIRDEDQGIREFEATKDRALFMLFTGPLMVLAVLGVSWLLWRKWRVRREAS